MQGILPPGWSLELCFACEEVNVQQQLMFLGIYLEWKVRDITLFSPGCSGTGYTPNQAGNRSRIVSVQLTAIVTCPSD
jgi:hypothetical protein